MLSLQKEIIGFWYIKLYNSKNDAMKAEYKLKKNYKLRKILKDTFNNK